MKAIDKSLMCAHDKVAVENLEQQIKELNVYKVQAYEQLEQIKELEELIDILFELAKSKVLIPSELYKRIEALKK